MILDFLRDFLGTPPEIYIFSDLMLLLEYLGALMVLLLVVLSLYSVVGSILRFFKRR